MAELKVLNQKISYFKIEDEDYISITDMLKSKDGYFFVSDWLRNRNTIEFLGIWEEIHNPNFNYGEFAIIKSQAGLNSYKISVKEWVEKTNAIGIMSKAGRYGGTYAHKDIAFEFGMWISPKFKLLLIKEFERLKAEEQKQLGWNAKRELSKINYKIHTDAIKQNLIPTQLTKEQINYIYAEEADVLNMALFGMTAKQWRNKNPNLDGNIRDYSTINELICLANLENLNSVFINDGLKQSERLIRLNNIAISQMKILNDSDVKYLKGDKMKKNYLILHGSFGSNEGNWFPWLKEYLEQKGKEVSVPQMPVGVGNQNFENWSNVLNKLDISENTVIIAHSIAPIFVCKYLITNQIKVKKLIFVCGFNNYLGIDSDFDAVNEPMFIDNFDDVKKYCKDIVCYYSDNDPYVKYDVEKAFADKLTDKQYVIKNGGHINAETGYTKFEEILKEI